MTNNTLTTFTNPTLNATIRVVEIDGNPWFVADDARKALGLTRFGGMYDHLNADERRLCGRAALNLGKGRGAYLISESGLYKLIMRSDKPQARAFQDWVTREVLPTIRKDGAYIMGEEKVRTGEMSEDEFILKAMTILQSKVERLTAERDAAIADRTVAVERAEGLKACVGEHQHTLFRFSRTLPGVNTMQVKARLQDIGMFYHKAGSYRVRSRFQHLFVERIDEEYGKVDIFPTPAGKEHLTHLYRKGLLPMKKGHAAPVAA